MRLSLITPTHNPEYLSETHQSLLLQTVTDWEWVIVRNGNCTLPDSVCRDKRVVVVDGGQLHNVGSLKRLGCESATGDAFVEMDHDDLLMPGNSLEKIREQFVSGAGFVYSDVAVFRFKAAGLQSQYLPFTFSSQHGWQDYPISVYGRTLQASRTFDISPRSLAEIYYCPDHVRAWSREAYAAAGGHNRELSVCDDHELMIRSYLTGVKFAHTGGCHYLYRMFNQNTVVMRNRLIQDTTRELKQRYFPELVEAWLRRTGLPQLDLSRLRRTGWTAERDLLQGFGESQYGHIVANTELQRLPGWQVREFMNAAYNALVPGGYLTIIVPEVHSGMGFGDVEWQSHFSAVSMEPYTRRNAARANGNIRCRFQQVDCQEVYPSDWHRDRGYKFLRFELAALKGQRFPGLQHI